MKTRTTSLPRRLYIFFILLLVPFILAACGGSSENVAVLPSVIEQIPEDELISYSVPSDAADTEADPAEKTPAAGAPEESRPATTDAAISAEGSDIQPDNTEDTADTPETDEPGAEPDTSPAPFTETVPRHDYSAGHGYYYRFLGSAAAAAYDDIFYACENFTGEVIFTAQITESDFYNAWDAFRYDHPEFFWIRNSRQGYSNSLGHMVSAEFTIPADAGSITEKLVQTADSIVSGAAGMPARDKVRYIYEWIIRNTAYSLSDDEYSQCAAGVLLNRRAVCAGYADAFKLLCDRAGISCATVVGDALNEDGSLKGKHAWNQVQIGASSCWVDVTWGDPQFETAAGAVWDNSYVNYGFLCIPDDPFLYSHRADPTLGREGIPGHFTASYAACSDPALDEYAIRGCLFGTADEAVSFIAQAAAGGQTSVSVKLAGAAAYQQTVSALTEGGGLQQILNSLAASVSECSYFTSPACRTLTVEFR